MSQVAAPRLQVSRRQRSTPYTPRIEALGVSSYSVVNRTILPKGFTKTVEEDYWHLREHVQLWDVSCQRQVELKGLDAARFAQIMTPRDLRDAGVGQCLYAPLIDQNAGMINDPIILKLADDHFWFSIADSDVVLWAKGLAFGLNVEIEEPDVFPLAVQGPKSDDLMAKVFGEAIRKIKFFRFEKLEFKGHPLVVARSGYSKQGGFEIYLDDASLGLPLWDALWKAGEEFNVSAGCPNLIERIEGGLFSYGNEMTRKNNPLECGLGQYCTLDGSIGYVGKDALMKINESGPERIICGVLFNGEKTSPPASLWPLLVNDELAGHVTSAIWSPRFENNVALGMVEKDFWEPGQGVDVCMPDGGIRNGVVVALPFDEANI